MRVAMSIFVSYSRVDQAWVDSLDDALRAAGIATWVDRRKIPIALPWFEEIRDAIEQAVLFHEVREIGRASCRGRV